MASKPTTVIVEPGSELDCALKASNDSPIELVRQGVRYRVTRIDDAVVPDTITTADEWNIWATYDPERFRKKLSASSNLLRGVDRDQLLHDLASQRQQSSRGRPG